MAEGYVYFVRCPGSGLIKIGRTGGRPSRRFDALQRACGVRLVPLAVVRGDRELESALHRRFAVDCRHGEWFDESPALLAFIERCGEPWPDPPESPPRPCVVATEMDCDRLARAAHDHFDRNTASRLERRKLKAAAVALLSS